jgi:hypothetical protein
MPKFTITEVTRYQVEADSMDELRTDWHEAGGESAKYEYEILDGSVTFAPSEEVICLLSKCPCSGHPCSNSDDYVSEGFHCEDCFRDCLKVEGEK